MEFPAEPTPPMKTFTANTHDLVALNTMVLRGLPPPLTAYVRTAADLVRQLDAAGVTIGDDAGRDLLVAGAESIRGLGLAGRWFLVIMVTVVETFLQDALAYAEFRHPLYVLESDRKIGYAQISTAESVEGLRGELCQLWAKGYLRGKTPSAWCAGISKKGAKLPPPEVIAGLDVMWQVRHCVVHNAGLATHDFARLYPTRAALGAQINVDPAEYQGWIDIIREVVEGVEAWVQARVRKAVSMGASIAPVTLE
jgi:hypothetical protein